MTTHYQASRSPESTQGEPTTTASIWSSDSICGIVFRLPNLEPETVGLERRKLVTTLQPGIDTLLYFGRDSSTVEPEIHTLFGIVSHTRTDFTYTVLFQLVSP